MKKILLAALAALTLFGVATDASAQAVSAHWAIQNVKFRSHAGTQTDPNAFNDLGTKDAVDSLVKNGLAVVDTSVAISTQGWAFQQAAGAATDSVTVCRILFFGTQQSTSSDSIYFKIQVSPNGAIWADCGLDGLGAPVIGTWVLAGSANPNTMAFTGAWNTGLAPKFWSRNFVKTIGIAAGSTNKNDIYHFTEYPWFRILVVGARVTFGSSISCNIAYPTSGYSKGVDN